MSEMEDALWREVLQRLTKIEENTKDISAISDRSAQAYNKACNNEQDIAELKENQKWAWRTIAGIGVSILVMVISKFIN